MDTFFLKVRTNNGQLVLKCNEPIKTIGELKNELSRMTNVPLSNINILVGFPPKRLDCADTDSMEESDINIGDTIVLEEKMPEGHLSPVSENIQSESDLKSGLQIKQEIGLFNQPLGLDILNIKAEKSGLLFEQSMDGSGIFFKQVVPADNSCLFTSVGFALGGFVDVTSGSYMREIIANELLKNEEEFNEAFLGRPNAEYCEWILKPDSWGGAIELAVLSKFYGLEIAVVDTVNAIINRFGEDQLYDHRIFLLFDGIHYDPLYAESEEESGTIQTLFPISDDRYLKEAEMLAIKGKLSQQFTDTKTSILTCNFCQMKLFGDKEAIVHAKATGHTTFDDTKR